MCISELRGLQSFQAKHPDVVVVAMSVTEEKDAIKKVIEKQKLEALRIAAEKKWQGEFGLSEAIPVTVVVSKGRVRVVHESVLADPVAYLEADLAAIQGEVSASK